MFPRSRRVGCLHFLSHKPVQRRLQLDAGAASGGEEGEGGVAGLRGACVWRSCSGVAGMPVALVSQQGALCAVHDCDAASQTCEQKQYLVSSGMPEEKADGCPKLKDNWWSTIDCIPPSLLPSPHSP